MTPKEQLVVKAKALGLQTAKLTIAQLQAAITEAETQTEPAEIKDADETPEPAAEATEAIEENDQDEEVRFAKAGRRSQKQILETEAEEARQTRKKQGEEGEKAPTKPAVKPPRPRSERRSKKYKKATKKIDSKKVYDTIEALELVLQTSTTKFDSSVDLVVSLGVDVKKAEQNVRDFVLLPSGSGKKIRIAVLADNDAAKQALEAGASIAGNEVFLQQLEKGVIDFDILIAMPRLMVQLSKYAKLLGPKGLMPNPKSGTISKDVARAVKEALAGRLEYRLDENGLIHASIGKVSFGPQKLKDNLTAVLTSIENNRPVSFKGIYIRSIHLSTTMGPSLRTTLPN